MDVLLEVNIGYEESKSGFAPEETEAAVRKIAEMPGISVKGLMAIPPIDPLYENTRKYFRNMYKLFIDIGAKNIDNSSMSVLSMGMSNDFVLRPKKRDHSPCGNGAFRPSAFINKYKRSGKNGFF